MREISDFIEQLRFTQTITNIPSHCEHTQRRDASVVSRHPRYTIVHIKYEPMLNCEDGAFVAYPTNSEHAKIVAHSKTVNLGPNYYHPGSVVQLEYGLDKLTNESEIEHIQFSFKQGSPKQLTRSIASKYRGARQKVVDAYMQYMQEQHVSTVTLSPATFFSELTQELIRTTNTLKGGNW